MFSALEFQLMEYIKAHPGCSVLDVVNAFEPAKQCNKIFGLLENLAGPNGVLEISGRKDQSNAFRRVYLNGRGYAELERERKRLEEKRLDEERTDRKESEKERRQFAHDWKIAVFGALSGALLSRPI